MFNLLPETTSIVVEQLLEEVNLVAKLSTPKIGLDTSKDTSFVKKFTSPEGARGSALTKNETLPRSPTNSNYSTMRPTSIQLVAK